MRYGIAYCVSRESLADMPWAVEFAEAKGAALVQFRPFAATGRGRRLANRLGLNEADKARAYFIAALLNTGDGPAIHIDLTPAEAACAQRNDYSVLGLEDAADMLLSDLINPLIIDEKGLVVPLSYGINERLALGRLGPNLPDLVAHYKEKGWRDLGILLDTAFASIDTHGEKFVDWFYHVVETSHKSSFNMSLPALHTVHNQTQQMLMFPNNKE